MIRALIVAGLVISATLTASAEGFNRAAWQHWIDADRDCQDTRTEVLIASSATPVKLSKNGCEVERGEWHDPYTGRTFTNPRDLDIDHIIPLKYTHEHGGSKWAYYRKREYANDPANLIAVDKHANRSKGDRGPGRWMPRREFCEGYGKLWHSIAARWGLQLEARDEAALNSCGQEVPRFRAEVVEAQLPCVEILVRPQIMLPMSRTDITIELRVRRHPDHRALVLVAEGGQAGASTSASQLDGEAEAFLHVITLKDKHAAPWQFLALVLDGNGKTLGRAEARITVPESEDR